LRIIRYRKKNLSPTLAAVTDEDEVFDLPYQCLLDIVEKSKEMEVDVSTYIEEEISKQNPNEKRYDDLDLLPPIAAPEVWAAGVTYFKSMEARNFEATSGRLDATTFYDKVYDAERPEIFFKSTKERTIGPNQNVYLRSDSNWQIPEPELGLVINKNGEILGYTIGNDMSCRDIEGENPLYLPQAKMWKHSCSIGPAIRLSDTIKDPYNLDIICRIYRDEQCLFEENANTSSLKRRYDELISYLLRDNVIFDGTVLLTGTCIVPPNDFTLQDGDRIDIEINGIGTLSNIAKAQS